jgi:hypothetical protein
MISALLADEEARAAKKSSMHHRDAYNAWRVQAIANEAERHPGSGRMAMMCEALPPGA